jgi:hypothetical protein
MWTNTTERWWNSRDLVWGLQIPTRDTQLVIFRWSFAFFYLLTGTLLSVILIEVSDDHNTWATNIVFDVILVIIFLVYCQNVHRQDGATVPNFFLCPQKSYVLFPGR